MADVFISYKAEDRGRLAPLVAALEADGLSVWWDARIGGGARWRETIEEQLAAARCVIVAWSRRSVGTDGYFVRDEAARAQRRGAYLPILLDEVDPPLGFGETQALHLAYWRGGRDDPAYGAVLAAVRAVLAGEAPPPRASQQRRPHRRALLAGGGALAVGAAGAGGWSWWRAHGREADADSIVVLPFANLSGDAGQAYFSEGLAEEIRSALTDIDQLKVLGGVTASAMRDMAGREIAARFGVGAILTGNVQRTPAVVRIGVQLVEAASGVQRWSDNYERTPGDIIAMETEIAKSVAVALKARLAPGETFVGTSNVDAHDLCLRASALVATADSATIWRQAIDLLDAALARDPNYAKAWALRAGAQLWLSSSASDMKTVHRWLDEAAGSARRAIAAAPNWAGGYAQLTAILAEQLDLPAALREARRATALGGTRASGGVTYFLATTGHRTESLVASESLIARDPLNAHAWLTRVTALYCARRHQEALAAVRQTLAWTPKLSNLHFFAALSLNNLGRFGEALSDLAALPDNSLYRLTGTAIVHAKLGDRRASDQALAQIVSDSADTANYQLSQVHAQRGEIDEALAALETAWRLRDNGLCWLPSDPLLDPLRQAPRFRALLAAIGF